MTKTQDSLAIDAAKAAQLVKTTAESTATALNIQYIQKDIIEIKEGIKALQNIQDGKLDEMQGRIDSLSKNVYIGMGIATTFAFLIPVLIKFFIK